MKNKGSEADQGTPPRVVLWQDDAAYAAASEALRDFCRAHELELDTEDEAAAIGVIVGCFERALRAPTPLKDAPGTPVYGTDGSLHGYRHDPALARVRAALEAACRGPLHHLSSEGVVVAIVAFTPDREGVRRIVSATNATFPGQTHDEVTRTILRDALEHLANSEQLQ